MSDTYRLQCRNGTWYYHRRVPDHLVTEFGRPIVKVSLGTKSKAEAKKLRTIQDLKWDAQFASLERHGTSPSVPSSKVTVPLADIVRDYVRRMDRKSELTSGENAPASREEWNALVENAEIEIGILRNPDDPRREEWISQAWDRVLQTANVSFEPVGPARDQFYALVRRALLELARRRLARVTDDFGRGHFDEMFNPARAPDVSFGALADEYLAWKKEVSRVNKRDAKTIDKIVTNVALVREIVGEDTPISRLDHDACERFLRLLAAVPANRTKLYPNISIEQAAERAALQNKPLLAHKTQLQYLGTLRDILQRALRKQLLTHNPAAGLQPLIERREANHEKRDPFSLAQLKTFFLSSYYTDCAKDRSRIYSAKRNVWRFWLPLICLFTGMRPREAAQIEVTVRRQII